MCNSHQKKGLEVPFFQKKQDQVIKILTSNNHFQFVAFWHLISNLRIALSLVTIFIMFNFSQNLNERRNFHILSFYISSCSKYDWLSVNIQTFINDKAKTFINERRSFLLNSNFRRVSSF